MPLNTANNVVIKVVASIRFLEFIDARVALTKQNRSACIRRWIKKGIAAEVAEEEAARAKVAKETP